MEDHRDDPRPCIPSLAAGAPVPSSPRGHTPPGRCHAMSADVGSGTASASASPLQRAAFRVALSAAERIRHGHLTVALPDGSIHDFGPQDAALRGEMRINDPAALTRILFGGETGAGEAYMDGLWSSPDLGALLRLAAREREALALASGCSGSPLSSRGPSDIASGGTRARVAVGTSRRTTT